MPVRSLIVLLISCAVALGVAYKLRGKAEAVPQGGSRVLVAAVDIPQGSFVQADKHLHWQPWPQENLSEQWLLEGAFDPQKLSGAVARREILKGEPVVENALVKSTEGGFMSAVLAPGKRAVSVAVDETSGNAGFIFPGDRVDLIVTHSIKMHDEEEDNKEALASETFIENVRVLAVGQSVDNPEQTAMLAKTVTLEVSKEQAEKINVAKSLGKISLSLRSLAKDGNGAPQDEGKKTRHYTRESDVLGLLSPRETSKKKVTVIRGEEREEIEFDQRGR